MVLTCMWVCGDLQGPWLVTWAVSLPEVASASQCEVAAAPTAAHTLLDQPLQSWSSHCSSHLLWEKTGKNQLNTCVEISSFMCLLVCFSVANMNSIPTGWINTGNCLCCHTEIEVADQTFYLTQSQYTDTGPTSPSIDPIMPGAWQGSHWSANF